MTPKQINDLKRQYNAMHEEGKEKYDSILLLRDKMVAITDTLIEEEGDEYDGVPLVFGSGYWVDEDIK